MPSKCILDEWESNGTLPKFPFDFVGQKYHKLPILRDIIVSPPRFFRSLSRRRFQQRSSAARRNHAAFQMTKLRRVSRRTILPRAVRYNSCVLSHQARMKDRQRT